MTTFTSLKDLGYQQASTSDTLESQAQYAIDHIAGFPADVPAEARAEIYEGYRLRCNDNKPPVTYAVIDGHYVLATDEHIKNKKVEKIEVGVVYAFSYTSQEFGKLANTNPALHGLVKKWRDDVADYCSNRLGDLKSKANKLLKKDQPSTRNTLDFSQSMTNVFTAQEKSVKVKQAKGDTTADPVKFKIAVTAFWKAYK
jgi:hypothetical protein